MKLAQIDQRRRLDAGHAQAGGQATGDQRVYVGGSDGGQQRAAGRRGGGPAQRPATAEAIDGTAPGVRAEDDTEKGGRQQCAALADGDRAEFAGNGAGDKANVQQFDDKAEQAAAADGQQQVVEAAMAYNQFGQTTSF